MARLHIALAVVILSGCGRSAAEQAADATQEIRSWDATARLANTEGARGAIPPGFVEQVRRAEAQRRAAAEAKLRKVEAQ
jgi:hypothetical protein